MHNHAKRGDLVESGITQTSCVDTHGSDSTEWAEVETDKHSQGNRSVT